jgi:hypothetical protein
MTDSAIPLEYQTIRDKQRASRPPALTPPPAGVTVQIPPTVAPGSSIGLTPEQARTEMAQIRRDRADGKISDYEWREQVQRRYLELGGVSSAIDAHRSGTAVDRAVMDAQAEATHTQDAITRSIDAEAAPRSPNDYSFSRPEKVTEEGAALDRMFRESLFALQVPPKLGNHIDESVTATARELIAAGTIEAQNRIVDRNEQRLREHWGPQFDANVEAVRALVRQAAERSPQMRQLIEQHPELYSGVDTMNYLLRLAERQSRTGARK